MFLALLTKHGIMSYKYYETRPIIPNDRYLPDKYKKRVKEIKLSSDFKYFKSATECRYFKAPCTHKVLDTINHKKILIMILYFNKVFILYSIKKYQLVNNKLLKANY